MLVAAGPPRSVLPRSASRGNRWWVNHQHVKAAEPTNIGIKAAKYDYICVTDDDSAPEPDALIKMIGFLQNDSKVAAVTCAVMARGSRTFMQKLQMIEYSIIAWNRKLLDFIDAVYVTPGPFALYKKSALLKVGLFDVNNLTQDIEIVWRLKSKGYSARMCLGARVYSETPDKFKKWWKQRVRHIKSLTSSADLSIGYIAVFSFPCLIFCHESKKFCLPSRFMQPSPTLLNIPFRMSHLRFRMRMLPQRFMKFPSP
jgi:cellulose synthase/poly-beta-1,6-N-acetylglucosamine synthase-like glycosyltransferase